MLLYKNHFFHKNHGYVICQILFLKFFNKWLIDHIDGFYKTCTVLRLL